tara:strand:- start:2261 stop:5416 length:3156 start_codon:yes stop_codon:yes gene_type:complete
MAGSDSLESKQISSTYKDLLQVPNANSGVDGTARTVMDGEGTESALQVSTAGVKSTGTLESAGNLTVGGSLTLGSTEVTSTATELNLLDGVTAVDTDLSSVSSSDDTLASAKSIKTYVDSQVQSKDDLSELSGTLDDISAGTTNKHFTATDETKLDGIETSADVTDATNVEAAGALMDSELTDLAGVKGVTISTLQPKPSEGAFVDGDKTKLDGIESSADVTDATNVEAAGALMDSELTDLAGVKGVTISTLQPKPSEGAFADGDKTKLDGITASANNYSHPNHSGEVTSTGDGATVIADNVVDEANLKVSNSPTDGYSLVARSGETGGLKWESVSGGGGGSASAAGSTGYLQFNDGSNNFDASSNLVWDDTNNRLGVGASSPSSIVHASQSTGLNFQANSRAFFGSLHSTHFAVVGSAAKADDSTTSQMVSTETSSGNGRPSAIQLGAGNIDFHTATSGTAGAAFDSLRMRIDSSGNVGINTAVPNSYTNYKALTINDTSGSMLDLEVNGTLTGELVAESAQVTLNALTSIPLVFKTANTERLRIDSSGASYFYGQLNVAGGGGSTTNRLNINYNANNGVAEIAPDSNSGNTELKFSTCISGTKSERMRIDSSGKVKFLNGAVGIGGVHTSSGQLDVLGTNTSTDITSVAGAGISLRNTSSTDNNYSFIRFDAASGNVASGISGVTTDQSPTRGELSFATTGSSGYAERMRIDSDGRVHIRKYAQFMQNDGTTLAGYLGNANTVNGNNQADLALHSTRYVEFSTGGNSTPRMVLDSGGNLAVGHSVPSFNSGGGLHIKDTSRANLKIETGSSACEQFVDGNDFYLDHYPTGSIVFRNNTRTERLRIASNGTLTSTSTSAADVAFFKSSHANNTNVYINNTNETTGNTANLYFSPAGDDAGAKISAIAMADFSTLANRSADLALSTRNNNNWVEAMRIKSTGRVTVKKSSNAEAQTVTIASNTATCDLDAGNNFEVSIPATVTTNIVPSNLTVGQSGVIRLAQGGGATTFSTIFKWQSGTTPTPSTSGVDLIAYYVDSSTTVSATYLTNVS